MTRRALIAGGAALAGGATWAALSRERPADDVGAGPPLYRRARFGAYAHNAPYPDLGPFFGLERIVGAHLPIMSWFHDLDVPWLDVPAERAGQTGHDLCIALQPTTNGRPIPFAEILAGRWDRALVDIFQGAARYPGTVSFRPFWEMNLDVATYSLNYPGADRQVADVDEWIRTWRHLVGLQRRVGGSAVRWMFCANGSDVGDTRMEAYWPGREWVDEVALDTYNGIWSGWTSFDDLVRPMYRRLVALAPGLPVAIGEVGCREATAPDEPSKADWIRAMFLSTEFPALQNVLFFHARTTSDYRLDSSASALAAFGEFLLPAGGPPEHPAPG